MELTHVATGPAARQKRAPGTTAARAGSPAQALQPQHFALCSPAVWPAQDHCTAPIGVQDACSHSMHLRVSGDLAAELAPAKTRVWQPDDLCWPLWSVRYQAALHVLVQASHGVHRRSTRAAGLVVSSAGR